MNEIKVKHCRLCHHVARPELTHDIEGAHSVNAQNGKCAEGRNIHDYSEMRVGNENRPTRGTIR